LTVTVPAASKSYIVINSTSTSQSVKIVGAGPTTGVTLVSGEKAVVSWNGSDFVRIGTYNGPGVFSSITNTGLTSGRVVYSTTGGLETDSANLTFNGTTLTAGGLAGPHNGTVGATTPTTGVFTTATARAAATQDSVILQGRAGGTGSYGVTITPTTLTASRTVTLPNADINFATGLGTAQGGTGLTSFTSGKAVYASSSSALTTGTLPTTGGGTGLAAFTTGKALYSTSTSVLTSGTLPTTGGGTGLASFTASGIVYASSTSALNTSTALSFADSTLTVNTYVDIGLGGGNVITNTAVGSFALSSNTTGGSNSAFGTETLVSNSTGSQNTALGYQALNANTTGNYNSAVGFQTLSLNSSGSNNTAIGENALGANLSASNNTACGTEAGYAITTGHDNTVVGYQTMQLSTTGSYNTALGASALLNLTTGSGNTSISPTTSAGSVSPVFSITTQSNRISMGSTAVTNAYVQVAWTVVSDARDKTDFAVVPHGLDFVSKLNPVAYRYKVSRETTEATGPVRYGFKAQDVLVLEGDSPVIVDADDPEKLRLNDQSLLAVLVNAIKELKAEFDEYKRTHP
jgi:hypothetical protein